ncbi:molybdopterin-guanine dinucleotide biosynthesis protein B [Paenibacillus sp. GCM10027627]|uniref:molybdopterin-guanine dinucleotide biosynthesis protein B n=1 Tax=unclassified Paenibacillus TaxID=185978 RepID=UPI00362C049F
MSQPTEKQRPRILQIVGYKNTGKTTLVCRLTEFYKEKGYRVGTIKHDGHEFHMDQPGTDTWRHQAAGADITAISSSSHTAILKKGGDTLDDLVSAMEGAVDLILVEGFKNAPYPKIILLREIAHLALAEQLVAPIALALWPEVRSAITSHAGAINDQLSTIPQFDLNDYNEMINQISKTIN